MKNAKQQTIINFTFLVIYKASHEKQQALLLENSINFVEWVKVYYRALWSSQISSTHWEGTGYALNLILSLVTASKASHFKEEFYFKEHSSSHQIIY